MDRESSKSMEELLRIIGENGSNDSVTIPMELAVYIALELEKYEVRKRMQDCRIHSGI